MKTIFLAFLVGASAQGCPPVSSSISKINVHVSPHTHDDVGWDETYLQYYNGNGPIGGRNVSRIIEKVVDALTANPARKFVYVEQAFFQLWFETQSPGVQAQTKALVANKQLQFVNGGWSMHDEANPTYIDMLDNTALGQRAIVDNFGVSALPTATWQSESPAPRRNHARHTSAD